MQKAISLNDVATFYVKGSAYRIYFWYMTKDDAISIMNNANLNDKMSLLQLFYEYIKMSNTTYYQKTEM